MCVCVCVRVCVCACVVYVAHACECLCTCVFGKRCNDMPGRQWMKKPGECIDTLQLGHDFRGM